MSARTDQVTDEYSRPVPGASIYVYNQDGTDAALTSDGTTPLAQPVISDEFGTYTYWAADGIYREDIWFAGKLRYQSVIVIGDVSALKGDPGSPGKGYATRAAMAARLAPALLDDVGLNEAGREGTFIVDLASNWTAAIAADTAQGLFVPSTADATKVYVRKFGNAPYNPTWWGTVAGDTSANASANTTAWQAMIATLVAISAQYPSTTQRGLGHVKFPEGIFWFGDAGAGAAIDLMDGALRLEGSGNAFDEGGIGTLIKLSGAITGIRVQSGDTSGATTSGQSHASAAGTSIRELAILGNYTTTESEAHGIHLRATAVVDSVHVRLMSGDGFQVVASDAANNGNANLWQLRNCTASDCRNGFYMDGNDANAGKADGCLGTGSRQWDFWDSSFLGNTFSACLAESFTTPSGGSPNAGVSFGGNQYRVIPGQETGASTNAPSGTAADNTWWFFIQAGGATTVYPAWASGTTYRAGGTYYNDNLNQHNSVYNNCYDESDGTIAWLANPALVLGGTLARSLNKSGNSGWGRAALIDANSSDASIHMGQGINVVPTRANQTAAFNYGGRSALLDNVFFHGSEPTLAPSGYSLVFDTTLGGTNIVLYDAVGFNPVYHITTPGSTAQFGTGAAQKNRFWAANLVVGSSLANARLLSNATSAPSATAAGQVYFNRTPTLGGPVGWIATGGSSASPLAAIPFGTVGTTVLGQSAVAVSHTGDTTETTLATITIPAATMGANGRVEIVCRWSFTGSAGTKTPRIKFGGTSLGTSAVGTAVTAFRHNAEVDNRNATNSQYVMVDGLNNAAAPTFATSTLAIDTTASVDITLTGQLATGTDTITLESFQVLLFAKA